jgi:hypothetical protein
VASASSHKKKLESKQKLKDSKKYKNPGANLLQINWLQAT